MTLLWILAALAAAVVLVGPVRRLLVTAPVLGAFRKVLPPMSDTEREALEAGTVWWEGALFGGRPDWRRLLALPRPALTEAEQAFLDGPVNDLCAMLDDWRVSHELEDLPPEIWQFIRDRGFLGLIIPRRYGGLGFSALAHSEVVARLATRSATATVSVMVPNSLGPAELLLHYGTEAQKDHYLPRLARGDEMPCFALTGPEAGSDAASLPDVGVVCRGLHEGREVTGIRLTWEKRYITLAPVATLLGLAFRLRDPERLLGGEVERGITLALIPAAHPGVVIGRRHIPLNGAFMNGPTSGREVFIPADWIIGGPARAGQGWRMLMECLAAGRAISLPSSCAGMMKLAARTTGAYARIRRQFRTPLVRMEGVDEALARIAAHTYVIDSARAFTTVAIDQGEKPAVVSAIMKYHATERGRSVVNDAMDVHGGKGICLGPGNYLGRAYQQVPVAITVEGANILTRSLIIFGQGALRCHPFLQREMAAARAPAGPAATRAFDAALWGHARFAAGNFLRATLHGLTGARWAATAGVPATRSLVRELSRLSAAFAFTADVALLTLGGGLKRREKLSGRLADALSQLYLASATLKRFHDDGAPEGDVPVVRWALEDACHRAEQALAGVARNLPNRWAAVLVRVAVLPLGERCRAPSDRLGTEVARALCAPGEVRERLTRGVFSPPLESDPVGRLDVALSRVERAEALRAILATAVRDGVVTGDTEAQRQSGAQARGLLSADDARFLEEYGRLERACIMVDDFPRQLGRVRPAEVPAMAEVTMLSAARRTGML